MKSRSASRTLLVALALSALAARCGSDSTGPTPPPPQPATLTITCPSALAGLSLRNQPVAMSWTAPATTGGTAPVQSTCTPASGTAFDAGVTTVTCTARDSATQTASCTFTVTITEPRVPVTRLLAFGDSITWGRAYDAAPAIAPSLLSYEFPPEPWAYPAQLGTMLKDRYVDQSLTVTNEGWPGERIAVGLARLPGNLAYYSPDALLLLHGANDLLNEPNAATVDHIVNRTRDMIRLAKSQRPGLVVLLANFPPQFIGVPSYRGAGWQLVPGLNAKLATMAQSEGVALVDVYTPMFTALKQTISVDGLHPTQQGYTVMATTFFDTIQKIETRAAQFR